MAEGYYRAAIALGKVVLRGLDVTTRSRGRHHVPASGPVVLAANHVSFPDFVFVQQALLGSGRYARFMCRHDIWSTPALARAMDGMQHIPVDRQAPAAAYLKARRLLAAGELVCAFPEGGISAAYTVRALMPGAVALARETGAPLVPVTIWGPQRLWAQKRSADEPLPQAGPDPRPAGRRALPRPDARRARRRPRHLRARAGHPVVGRGRGAAAAAGAPAASRRARTVVSPAPRRRTPWSARSRLVVDAMPRSAVPPTWGPL